MSDADPLDEVALEREEHHDHRDRGDGRAGHEPPEVRVELALQRRQPDLHLSGMRPEDPLFADELLGVPHVRVNARLHHGEQLLGVIAIVVHPLLK
jgi:hypothetical protein